MSFSTERFTEVTLKLTGKITVLDLKQMVEYMDDLHLPMNAEVVKINYIEATTSTGTPEVHFMIETVVT